MGDKERWKRKGRLRRCSKCDGRWKKIGSG